MVHETVHHVSPALKLSLRFRTSTSCASVSSLIEILSVHIAHVLRIISNDNPHKLHLNFRRRRQLDH